MTEENLGIFLRRLVSLILASALFALALPLVSLQVGYSRFAALGGILSARCERVPVLP